jgi:hypothetical protein
MVTGHTIMVQYGLCKSVRFHNRCAADAAFVCGS